MSTLDNNSRSLVKAITWRITGSLDTFFISWIITGQAHLAAGISSLEFLSKIILYYFHERLWCKVSWGIK